MRASTIGAGSCTDRSYTREIVPVVGSTRSTELWFVRLIVYNPRHSTGRIANSLAHELSHHILEHEPAPAIGIGGCRHWNGTQEAEADWLAGALLVPRASALAWLRRSDDYDAGARHFGVSVELFTWRANHTGAVRQIDHARARRRQAPR